MLARLGLGGASTPTSPPTTKKADPELIKKVVEIIKDIVDHNIEFKVLTIKPGDRVEGLYQKRGEWYSGEVMDIDKNAVSVKYDSFDRLEDSISFEFVESLGLPDKGSLVEAFVANNSKEADKKVWMMGTVVDKSEKDGYQIKIVSTGKVEKVTDKSKVRRVGDNTLKKGTYVEVASDDRNSPIVTGLIMSDVNPKDDSYEVKIKKEKPRRVTRKFLTSITPRPSGLVAEMFKKSSKNVITKEVFLECLKKFEIKLKDDELTTLFSFFLNGKEFNLSQFSDMFYTDLVPRQFEARTQAINDQSTDSIVNTPRKDADTPKNKDDKKEKKETPIASVSRKKGTPRSLDFKPLISQETKKYMIKKWDSKTVTKENKTFLKEEFKKEDRDSKGSIDPSTFKKLLVKYGGFELSGDAWEGLLDTFCILDSSKVSYKIFLLWIHDEELDEEEHSLAMLLRDKFRSLGSTIESRDKKLHDMFEKYDEDRSGFLDEKEFGKFMKATDLNLNDKHYDLLWEIFDKDESGKIEYEEFLWFIYPEIDEKMVVSKLSRSFSLLRKKGTDVDDIFLSKDKDQNGHVTKVAARELFISMGLPLTEDEKGVLLDMFDYDGDGTISYDSLIAFSKGERVSKVNAKKDGKDIGTEGMDSGTMRILSENTRNALNSAARSMSKGSADKTKSLKKIFSEADRSNDGFLDQREFKSILEKYGVKLAESELVKVMFIFDLSGDNKISYNEFISFMIDNEADEEFEILVEDIRTALRGQLKLEKRGVKSLFEKYDRKSSGELSENDFKAVMKGLNVEISSETLKAVIKRCDRDGDGFINYSEFSTFICPSMDADVVEGKLRRIMVSCKKNGINMSKMFEKYDAKKKGLISAVDFRTVFRHVGLPVTNEEMTALIDRYNSHDEDLVNYESLIKACNNAKITSGADIGDSEEDVAYYRQVNAVLVEIFEHFDEDKSGSIDVSELAKATRSLGMDLNDAEIQELMSQADGDKSGNINFDEFRTLMLKRHKENIKDSLSGEKLQQIEDSFKKYQKGSKASILADELGIIIREILEVKLKRSECEALIAIVDHEGDGKLEFSEFKQLISLIKDEDSFSKIEPLAKHAIIKILRGKVMNAKEYLLEFSNLPSSFRTAVCKQLDYNKENSIQDCLLPLPAQHGLQFHDIHPVDNAGLRTVLRPVYDAKNAKGKAGKGPIIEGPSIMQGVIEISLGKGIPMPPDDLRKNIISRQVRVCLFDDPDGISKDTFVGNQYTLNAGWMEKEEDVWQFGDKWTGKNHQFLVRSDWPLQQCGDKTPGHNCKSHLFVLLELTITIVVTGGKPPKEMTCGWCVFPLEKINALTSSQSMSKPLMGGTPSAPQEIKDSEILQRRTGYRRVVKAFTGKNNPTLTITARAVTDLSKDIQNNISYLPHSIIVNLEAVDSIKQYRDLLAETLLTPAKPSMELIFYPALALFPHILADIDVFKAFLVSWEDCKSKFDSKQKKDNKFIKDKFNSCILRMWPAFCSHNPLLSSEPSVGPAGGRTHINQGENLTKRTSDAKGETRTQLLNRLATRDASKFFSPPPEDHAVFAPFSIDEIAFIPKPQAATLWGALESTPAAAALNLTSTNGGKKGRDEEGKDSERENKGGRARKDSENLYDSDDDRSRKR